MQKVKCFFQHHLNPLHVYCRLRGAGLKPVMAQRMCTLYEKFVYNLILK
ncbi:hypothetical protein [Desulfonatronovibrio hydrogenovorans]|nr:hypothetical protein [Desulfonatronovibrio hydrogenovorans]